MRPAVAALHQIPGRHGEVGSSSLVALAVLEGNVAELAVPADVAPRQGAHLSLAQRASRASGSLGPCRAFSADRCSEGETEARTEVG